MTEDEVVRWHHQLSGHEFEQAPGGGEGQGNLACCSPWGCKELDMTQRLNHNDKDKDKMDDEGAVIKDNGWGNKVNETGRKGPSDNDPL